MIHAQKIEHTWRDANADVRCLTGLELELEAAGASPLGSTSLEPKWPRESTCVRTQRCVRLHACKCARRTRDKRGQNKTGRARSGAQNATPLPHPPFTV